MDTRTQPQDLERLAARVRRLRVERGWSQRELADRMGAGLRTVEYIEAAAHRAFDATYGRLALALGVPLSEILDEEQ